MESRYRWVSYPDVKVLRRKNFVSCNKQLFYVYGLWSCVLVVTRVKRERERESERARERESERESERARERERERERVCVCVCVSECECVCVCVKTYGDVHERLI